MYMCVCVCGGGGVALCALLLLLLLLLGDTGTAGGAAGQAVWFKGVRSGCRVCEAAVQSQNKWCLVRGWGLLVGCVVFLCTLPE